MYSPSPSFSFSTTGFFSLFHTPVVAFFIFVIRWARHRSRTRTTRKDSKRRKGKSRNGRTDTTKGWRMEVIRRVFSENKPPPDIISITARTFLSKGESGGFRPFYPYFASRALPRSLLIAKARREHDRTSLSLLPSLTHQLFLSLLRNSGENRTRRETRPRLSSLFHIFVP